LKSEVRVGVDGKGLVELVAGFGHYISCWSNRLFLEISDGDGQKIRGNLHTHLELEHHLVSSNRSRISNAIS